MTDPRPDNVTMEGVKIIFRNFKGKPNKFNAPGERNFGVILPSVEVAEQMLADGWAVKYLKPSLEEQEEGIEQGPPWLQVKVAYDRGRPPRIVLVTSRGRTHLDEDTVKELDEVDIVNVDLIVNPFPWDINGRKGIAAYCKTMFVTIDEDELEQKYAEMESQ